MGGCSIDAHGTALTDEVLEACRAADAVLLGAVGGPKWDTTDPDAPRPEQGPARPAQGDGPLRQPAPGAAQPGLVGASPLREERIAGTDLLVVRELTGGIYFGDSGRDGDAAHDTCEYSAAEIERIARTAFEAARRRAESSGRKPKLTSVDKANVLETSRLWREVVTDIAPDYADVALDHLLVDNAAMQLVSRPADFDVIVTENLFGDILSDESAMLTGSLGMLPSASLGADGAPASSSRSTAPPPDIAGKGIANPLATFLSVAMMLRHGLDRPTTPAGSRRRSTPSWSAACAPRTCRGDAGSAADARRPRRGRGRDRGDDHRGPRSALRLGSGHRPLALDELSGFVLRPLLRPKPSAIVAAGVDAGVSFRCRRGDVDAELAGRRRRVVPTAAGPGRRRVRWPPEDVRVRRRRRVGSGEREAGRRAGEFFAGDRRPSRRPRAASARFQGSSSGAEFVAELVRRHRAVGEDRRE